MSAPIKELIAHVHLFDGEDLSVVTKHLEGCRMDAYSPGEYILRTGEYDENCCFLLSGRAKVELPKGEAWKDGSEKFLEEGDVFGEVAALSGVPRTVDIIAVEPCTILEIPKETMFGLLDNMPTIRTKIEALYKDRVLTGHLASVPIFSSLPADIINSLKEKATIEVYREGDVIFRQGDLADAFYMVLFGFVKVDHKDKKKSKTMAYLKGEQYFGEFALLKEGGKRYATITAISHSELIRIARDDFIELLEAAPSIKEDFELAAKKRKEKSEKLKADPYLASTLLATIEAGIIQTGTAHLLDTTKCVQCGVCEHACAALHGGVSRLARKGIRLNGFLMAATSCRHCKDPACMYDCPTGAISRDISGEIYHKDFCIACGSCARNCPYGNIILVNIEEDESRGFIQKMVSRFTGTPSYIASPVKADGGEEPKKDVKKKKKSGRKVVKCDMCRDYEFLGCVYNCPTGAMILVNPSEYFAELITIE